jgi:DNA-binding NarL/FixJ family response regulator
VHEHEDTVFEAIHAGASGYLSKSASLDELKDAFTSMRAGGTYMSPQVAGIAIRSLSRKASEAEQATRAADVLTERELEVLDLLGNGMSARNIAKRLSISERTVNTHIGHIYRKLGVNNRVDAVLAAMRLGLVKNTG